MRMTKHRQAILDTLEAAHGTLTAADIHTRLPHINLVTIYRNLEQFVTAGYIKKISLGTGDAHFEHQEHPHHHARCRDCDRIIHFNVAPDRLAHVLGIKNFAIDDVDILVQGSCAAHEHPRKRTSST